MKSVIAIQMVLTFAIIFPAFSADSAQTVAAGKVLFVHDPVKKSSGFYVDTITARLKSAGFDVDEAAVTGAATVSPAAYRTVVIYGMVMAFNFKSDVRSWLKKVQSLKDKKLFIFVTTNRWFKDNLQRDLVDLTTERQGTVVDAVSMATSKMTVKEKVAKIEGVVGKVEK